MQRYFGNEKKENTFLLGKDDLYHIKTVMRMKDGDLIEVVYQSKLYTCILKNVQTEIGIHIETEEEVITNNTQITLLIPLLKEAKMDLILQKSTELGVTTIIPYIAERSLVKIEAKKEENKLLRWNKICKEASEQSKRTDIPLITQIHTLRELQNIEGTSLICSTTEKEQNIKKFLHTSVKCDKINIIIGPEGGLSTREENTLVEYGFKKVSLGKQIMRVETVPIFVMSVINYEYME